MLAALKSLVLLVYSPNNEFLKRGVVNSPLVSYPVESLSRKRVFSQISPLFHELHTSDFSSGQGADMHAGLNSSQLPLINANVTTLTGGD